MTDLLKHPLSVLGAVLLVLACITLAATMARAADPPAPTEASTPAPSPEASPSPDGSPSPAASPSPEPGKAADKVPPTRIDLVTSVRDLQRTLVDWFLSLEQGNVVRLEETLSSDFMVTADRLRLGQDRRRFLVDNEREYLNLIAVEFRVDVNPPRFDPTGERAQVDVRWDRRARFLTSGQEWLLTNQRATFFFRRDLKKKDPAKPEVQPPFQISRVQGDNFIRTNYTGVTAVDQGTVDGQPVTFAQGVLAGVLGAGDSQIVGFPGIMLGQRPVVSTPTPGPPPPVSTPELAVQNVRVQIVATGRETFDIAVFFDITNSGAVDSPPTTQTVTLDSTLVQTTTAASVPAGTTQPASAFFGAVRRGPHIVTVTLAPVAGETNTSDNTATLDFSLGMQLRGTRVASLIR